MRAVTTLLSDLIDYAGLFPPAGLALPEAMRRYAAHRDSPEAWMLGRFVVPAARLDELAAIAEAMLPNDAAWRVSALLGTDAADDLARISAFHTRLSPAVARVDSIETKIGSVDDVGRVAAMVAHDGPPDARLFLELPPDGDAPAFADAARDAGAALKLRTGGTTADAFPPPDTVIAFLAACVTRGVSCKLTAGLHHPLRGEHPLTYESGCPHGTMFGFLTVFAAAALLAAGHPPSVVAPLLEERDPSALTWAASPDSANALCWRGLCAGLTHLAVPGRRALSFGSCSFNEAVADLRALGLLPTASANDSLVTALRS